MSKHRTQWQAVIDTPLGPMGVRIDERGLRELEFLPATASRKPAEDALTAQVVEALERYFREPGYRFSLPLVLQGTPFQQSVWRLLQEIPKGEVWTYGRIAKRLKTSPRAVGNACRRNPVPVIVPCHRVVGATGLGGYSGETQGRNMEIKRWLLAHEGVELPA